MFCQLPRHVKPPPPAASGIDLHQVNDRPAETLHNKIYRLPRHAGPIHPLQVRDKHQVNDRPAFFFLLQITFFLTFYNNFSYNHNILKRSIHLYLSHIFLTTLHIKITIFLYK